MECAEYPPSFGQPMDVFVRNPTELAEFERERITQARRLLADR